MGESYQRRPAPETWAALFLRRPHQRNGPALPRFESLSELSERLADVLECLPRDELFLEDFRDAEDTSVDDCSTLADAVAPKRQCKVALVQDRIDAEIELRSIVDIRLQVEPQLIVTPVGPPAAKGYEQSVGMPAFDHAVDVPTAEGFVVPKDDVFCLPQDRLERSDTAGTPGGLLLHSGGFEGFRAVGESPQDMAFQHRQDRYIPQAKTRLM
jgi:hypothetical protein